MKIFCFASLLLGLVSVLAACQANAPMQGDTNPTSQSGKTKSTGDRSEQAAGIASEPAGEKIDPPQNIMGHYLHCAYESKPTDAIPEGLVGCRFDNSQGQRVPASTLGASYKFSAQLAAGASLTVYNIDLTSDNRYDAMFLFIGTSAQDVSRGVNQATMRVDVTQVKSTGLNQTVSAKFASIERDAATLPEPRTSDYSTVRDTILTQAREGGGPPPPAGN